MALIPDLFTQCVVALGVGPTKEKCKWVASGFLYGHFVKEHDGQKQYSVLLVTNRHVFQDESKVYIRCNPIEQGQAKVYPATLLDAKSSPRWFGHPNPEIDVAVLPINLQLLKAEGMDVSFFTNDGHTANRAKLKELGISEGDFAYVLGFPMGNIGGERNYVLVRSGTIARIRDALTGANNEFLIDAFVFPGNSGGPVVSKPEALAIQGTKSQNAAYLIGIVKSYVPYREAAVSQQTGQIRVIFEENSGLAAVHPIDFVDETIQECLNVMKTREQEQTIKTEQQSD